MYFSYAVFSLITSLPPEDSNYRVSFKIFTSLVSYYFPEKRKYQNVTRAEGP